MTLEATVTGLDTLTTPECWQLLAEHEMGRVAYTEGALPTIMPVAYAVVGSHFVLRCRSERMADQLDGQVVALEIEDGPTPRGDRTVVVATGLATRLLARHDDPDEPHCPLGCEHRSAVRVQPGRVVGQRLHGVA